MIEKSLSIRNFNSVAYALADTIYTYAGKEGGEFIDRRIWLQG